MAHVIRLCFTLDFNHNHDDKIGLVGIFSIADRDHIIIKQPLKMMLTFRATKSHSCHKVDIEVPSLD